MNGCGAIPPNDEAKNNFYIVHFTPVTYTLQEYVESNGNELASGYLVWNSIYTCPGQHKPRFYIESY